MSDLPSLLERPASLRRGACVDKPTDWFFPDPFDSATARKAKAVCAECPVISDCLAFAVATDARGIWGGVQFDNWSRRRRAGRTPGPINHGTESGYRTHRRRGEVPCDWCMEGNRAATRERKARTA